MNILTIDDINKYNPDGSRIPLYPARLVKKKGDEYIIKTPIPASWEISDFSPTENLIEIQDLLNGERFWIEPKSVFVTPFIVGFAIRILNQDRSIIDVKLREFGSLKFRGRQYITAVFKLLKKEAAI